MTVEPQGLGAHHRSRMSARRQAQSFQALSKLRAPHVIGIAAEGRIPEGGVWRVRALAAPSTQLLEPVVTEPQPRKAVLQGLPAEVGVAARPWKSPDVGDL